MHFDRKNNCFQCTASHHRGRYQSSVSRKGSKYDCGIDECIVYARTVSFESSQHNFSSPFLFFMCSSLFVLHILMLIILPVIRCHWNVSKCLCIKSTSILSDCSTPHYLYSQAISLYQQWLKHILHVYLFQSSNIRKSFSLPVLITWIYSQSIIFQSNKPCQHCEAKNPFGFSRNLVWVMLLRFSASCRSWKYERFCNGLAWNVTTREFCFVNMCSFRTWSRWTLEMVSFNQIWRKQYSWLKIQVANSNATTLMYVVFGVFELLIIFLDQQGMNLLKAVQCSGFCA